MQNNTDEKRCTQKSLLLSIPDDLYEDMRILAEHNEITVEQLVFSYVVEGITGESQLLKRLKFNDQIAENLGEKNFNEKSSREIANEFNLVY